MDDKGTERSKVDLTDWVLDAMDLIAPKFVLKVAAEALELALDKASLVFPAEWGDKPDIDPLTVRLQIPDLYADADESRDYEISLREALAGTIADCRSDGSCAVGLGRIGAALRELADEIDAAITAAPPDSD